MTTSEINELIDGLRKEVRAVKAHNTRLSKALIKADIDVPVPNWKELQSEEEEEE